MLNIASILKFIKQGLTEGNDRYVITDNEHILDTSTGIEIHIYDDWFKITYNDEIIATMRDFDTTVEQPVIWEIKALITPAEIMESRKDTYMTDIKNRREKLSEKFEYPEPIRSESPVIEEDTTEYMG